MLSILETIWNSTMGGIKMWDSHVKWKVVARTWNFGRGGGNSGHLESVRLNE